MTATNQETAAGFAIADLEYAATVLSPSDGDLWPSAWADDGGLYAACGDGRGFSSESWADMVVNRIDGTPPSGLSGVRLAAGRAVAPVWTDPSRFNSKPTGMVAVDGNGDGADELYLAVQDLGFGGGPEAFNEAPAAGIAASADYGRTWSAVGPMFSDHRMTTLMFLDFGQSNSRAVVMDDLDRPGAGEYVYAFGLDGNWRGSYSGVVPDPEELYLARVHRSALLDRSAWEFWAGLDDASRPRWTAELSARVPVLTDRRRIWVGDLSTTSVTSPLAQGGVVYNPGLNRFLYTSWTEFTFEFYEAPTPWGPWRLFLQRDFGPYPWQGPASPVAAHGGYATTIPSKFVSADGRDLWVQSNWFVRSGSYTGRTYRFSLRRLRIDPATADPAPQPSGNLASSSANARPIAARCRCGQLGVLNDGLTDRAEDSGEGRASGVDYWGYVWPAPLEISEIALVHGPWDLSGGWFEGQPVVEVRCGGTWQLVDATCTPPYPGDETATGGERFVWRFPCVLADGVRVTGIPGGPERYTSIAELEVFRDSPREGKATS